MFKLMGGLPFARPDQHYEAPSGAIVPGARSVLTVKKITIIAGHGGGLFAYTGAPALGNLLATVAAAAGTDPYGNAYVAGVASYGQTGGTFFAVALASPGSTPGSVVFYSAPAAGGPWTLRSTVEGDSVGNINMTPATGQAVNVFGNETISGSIGGSSMSLSEGVAAGDILLVTNTVSAPTGPTVEFDAAAAGDRVQGIRVSGDSRMRLLIDSNGKLTWGSGTVLGDTNLARDVANHLIVTTADLDVGTTGRGLQVAEGSNAKQGTATLAAGTVTVANTSVTANSRIFLTAQTSGAAPGALRVSARTAGTSFTITSTSNTDTSLVAYEIFEPG